MKLKYSHNYSPIPLCDISDNLFTVATSSDLVNTADWDTEPEIPLCKKEYGNLFSSAACRVHGLFLLTLYKALLNIPFLCSESCVFHISFEFSLLIGELHDPRFAFDFLGPISKYR